MEVKTGELPSWTLMQDITPKGNAGAFQRGYYYQVLQQLCQLRKRSVAGLGFLWCWQLTRFPTTTYFKSFKRNSNISNDTSSTEEDPAWALYS